MGGKKGFSAPKIKISAPKAIAKAVGSVTNPLSKAVAGAGKGLEKVVSSAAKGDIKGVAGAGMSLVDTAKNLAKDSALQNLSIGTGALGALGSLTGAKDITKLSSNINAEGQRGVNKYGDAALDVGANVATGGTYGLAKTAAQSLASGGIGGLISGKGLQDAALGAAGSYAGVDPNMLKMGLSAAQGDLKGAALQGLGSFGGIDPSLLKTGAAALSGDKGGLAAGLASQFGAGDTASSMLGAAAGGDIKGALLGKLAGATGVPNDILKQVSTGKFDVGELAKNANLTASLRDTAKAYLPGSVSSMIDGAKSAGRVVESANAYKDDIQNQALDQMGRAGLPTDQVRAIQDVQDAAQSAYSIAKGDTLAAIAKKQGTTVEALMAANPNIKDPNKIAAGMKLNLPGATPAGRQPETPEQTAARRAEADRKVLEAAGSTPQEPGLWDKTKDFFSGAGDKIGGAVDAAGNFIKENPMLATGAIQAGAATAGYMAGDAARDKQQKLLEQQILDTQGVDALKNYQQSKQRETAYAEQDKYQQDVIAGGGRTAQQALIEQEGQLKAAGMDAGARLAGVEQQSRMGQGVTGAGSTLASILSGGQSGANTRSSAALQSNASAAQNLKETYGSRASALESKALGDINLASLKDQTALRKVSEVGDVRTQQGTMAAQEGDAQGRLATGLADIATRGVLGQQIGPSDATAKEREIAAQAQVDKEKEAKAADDKAKADLAAKANAAGNVSGTAPTQGNIQAAGQTGATTQTGRAPAATTQADKFNQAGQAPQPPVSIPYQRPPEPPKPANPMDNMMNIVKNPGAAVQDAAAIAKKKLEDAAKQKAEQLKQQGIDAAKKAVGGIVPDSMKNIFKI